MSLYHCAACINLRALVLSGQCSTDFYQLDALEAVGCPHFPQPVGSSGH